MPLFHVGLVREISSTTAALESEKSTAMPEFKMESSHKDHAY
jgi:hypothetical protein